MGWLIHANVHVNARGDWSPIERIDPFFNHRTDNADNVANVVYRLVALADDQNLTPTSVPRVAGKDTSGTLYIGQSRSLFGRVGQLLNALRGNGGHNAGNYYHTLGMNVLYPLPLLGITWIATENQHEAEKSFLQAYAAAFRETPPLNRKAI